MLSSKNRMDKIVNDIILDFNTKPRLSSKNGNAILVASSIYESCKYYELFQNTELRDRCAVITSYISSYRNIVMEDTGENTETDKEFIHRLYESVLTGYNTDNETYVDNAKAKFIKEPEKMRLLIVVDKLLTGFDAPACTYLYIDKTMKDHGLFQAICRVNRLDGDDKSFGYIVDYKNLFENLVNEEGSGAIQVYTSELEYDSFEKADCDVLMKDRLKAARERLDNALEEIALLCEPVKPPKGTLEYIHYFCGNTEIEEALKATEVRRTALYKAAVALIRAYANIAADLVEAGYTNEEIAEIERLLNFYINLRNEIKRASGETIDLKTYEADMRHLIDNYIQAEDPQSISPFANMTLLDIIAAVGIDVAINGMPDGIRSRNEAVAETIENNIRQKIIREHLIDPAFFEEMSTLLNEIILQRRANAITYAEYLQRIAKLARNVNTGNRNDAPDSIRTPAQRALYNNLDKNESLALEIHESIMNNKPDSWRGNEPRERVIKAAIFLIIKNEQEVERIFEIVKQQAEY